MLSRMPRPIWDRHHYYKRSDVNDCSWHYRPQITSIAWSHTTTIECQRQQIKVLILQLAL